MRPAHSQTNGRDWRQIGGSLAPVVVLVLRVLAPPVLAALETYDSPIPMAETARVFGVQQTTLLAA